MTRFVIDTSAMIEFISGDQPDPALRRMVLTAAGTAPELIDLEAASVIRRMVLVGTMPAAEGLATLTDISETPITRVSHRPLLTRVWELRDVLTAYDAAYIALAEHVDAPLLTCDARLGRANGHQAEVLVYPRS